MRSHHHITSPFMGQGGSSTIHRAECSPVRASTAHPPRQAPSALQLDRVQTGLEGLPELGGKVSSRKQPSLPLPATTSLTHLLTGCHVPQLNNSILEFLLSHNGNKGDARFLTVLQLIQELGVLLVQYFCLEWNQSTVLYSARACFSAPHHHSPRHSGPVAIWWLWMYAQTG